MPGKYLTLDPDLAEHADRFTVHLRDDGFRVRPEAADIAFPNTPSLHGTKNTGRYFVEVSSSCNIAVLRDWVRYAKTRRQPTFVSLVVPMGTNISGRDLAELRSHGVGLYMSGDDGVVEIIPARDLGVTISLPDFAGLTRVLQKKLRPVYRKFDAGDYVGGFRDACQILEDDARERLKAEVAATRVKFVKNGKPLTRTAAQIDKLTLGQLAAAHAEIVAPNSDDVLIGKAISAVNADRVGAVHRTNSVRAIAKIRENVAAHMWKVVAALKKMN